MLRLQTLVENVDSGRIKISAKSLRRPAVAARIQQKR